MKRLDDCTKAELSSRLAELTEAYEGYKARGLKLDMSRGKPSAEQLDLTLSMLDCVNARDGYRAEDGTDTRNYGLLDGIAEAKRLFADMLGTVPDEVIVGGNSSLNMMFDYISTAYSHGVCGGEPWCRQGEVKFLCPAPGYDRHFGITEYFGIEMLTVPMTEQGPDMTVVESLVADPLVKGMWCVPMYSNPDGITYSDETVRRIAALRPAASDFRVIWDNAYCVHHLYAEHDHLLNIRDACRAAGNDDLVVQFASTSKISFPGSGMAAMTASPKNVADVKARMTVQTIGHDKLNMLRHARYFGDMAGVTAHMEQHAALLRPRFDTVLTTLRESGLREKGVATWHEPRGGYFVSVYVRPGCAKETVRLLAEAGVKMTAAGATYPYGIDPADSNIRIAPSFPSVAELKTAMELFCLCAERAAVSLLLEQGQ